MTDTDIPDLPDLPSRAGPGSQATQIEQSRAIAEVQAQVVIAQRFRRVVPSAVAAMRESCQQRALADRAFFRFNRAGSSITGPTIHLARELARIWGNVNYGIAELRRDDHESELIAYAWDVETNVRSFQTFIVPHRRDTKSGAKDITDLRDIYENNANMGARRLREAILSVLPKWFTDEAEDICTRTLDDGGGVPLSRRVADTVTAWENEGVTRDQLQRRIGAPIEDWTAHDLATLRVTWTSIKRGELNKADEFPPRRITAADVLGDDQRPDTTPAPSTTPDNPTSGVGNDAPPGGSSTPDPAGGASPEPAGPRPPGETRTGPGKDKPKADKLTAPQQATITRHFVRLGIDDVSQRRWWLARFLDLPAGETITATSKLNRGDADRVIDRIARFTDRDELDASLSQDELPGGDQ